MTTLAAPGQRSWIAKLRRFILWLNDLPVFNTEKWPAREWGTRLFALAATAYFLFGKISSFPAYLKGIGKWTDGFIARGFSPAAAHTVGGLAVASNALVILIFLSYALAWATRARAQKPARGFMEVVFPFIVAFLPLQITATPTTLSRWLSPDGTAFIVLLTTIYVLMVGGFLMTFLSVLNLRTAFSIMAEARPLVRSGFFRWVRHPIYTGNFIMLLGALILHLSPKTAFFYVVMVLGHVVRARLEERKLTAVYPEYEDYRRTTGMFWPKPGRFLALPQSRNRKEVVGSSIKQASFYKQVTVRRR